MRRLAVFRTPRAEDRAKLEFIRRLPCVICNHPGTDAAHIRMSDARVGKKNPGIGQKPDDAYTISLCRSHHELQHSMGDEKSFWDGYGIDPVLVALAIHAAYPDEERAMRVIDAQQHFRWCSAYTGEQE